MSTSGTTNFSQTRNELIKDAFQILNIYGIGKTIASEDITFASNMLNKMLKAWETYGLHLWTKTEAVLFLQQYQNSYLLGSTAKAANADDVIMSQLTEATASGATSINLAATSGMLTGDNIGIVLADSSLFWTTIQSVDTSTSLTLANSLTGDANDQGLVYTYTTALGKPLRILNCRLCSGIDNGSTSSLVEIPITLLSYDDYSSFPVKTQNTGVPTEATWLPQNNNTRFNLLLRPNDCNYRINFTYERKIEDVTNTADDFDFPSEWLEAITYQLAVRLARPYGQAAALTDLVPMADQMLQDLLSWDSEQEYVEVFPECN